MEVIRLSISLFISVFVGWNILYLFSLKSDKLAFPEKMFVSYGLGLGAISMEMFIFHFFDIKFSMLNILMPWTLLVAVNTIIYFRIENKAHGRPVFEKADNIKSKFLKYFLIGGISFEVLHAFFKAVIRPIEAYDAIATYAIRSKIFYLANSVPKDFFYNLSLLFPHPDYPLNIPLSETFVYLFSGSLNDQLVKVIFPLYFVAILGILYFGIRRISGRNEALLFTFLLSTIPQFNNFATNAYHDVPFAYYCFISTLFLLYWFKETKSLGLLFISAAMTALSAWTKNEGFVYCMANIILLAVFLFNNRLTLKKRGLFAGLSYIGIILLILAPWLWVKLTANLVNSDVGSTTLSQLNIFKQFYKLWPIFYEFQRQIFGPKKWNIIWIAIIFFAVVYRKKILNGNQKYITMSLVLIISGYVFAYLIGRDDIWHMVGTTWSRMPMHFLPLAVYWLACLLKDEIKT